MRFSAKKISIIAEPKHIAIAPHNTCSPVGAIAEMHLSKSIPNFEIMEYHAEFYSPHYFDVFTGFPRQKDGFVSLSDKPGLGLELNEKENLGKKRFPQLEPNVEHFITVLRGYGRTRNKKVAVARMEELLVEMEKLHEAGLPVKPTFKVC